MNSEGSELTKDDRESQIYDEFERFSQIKGETIQVYYVRGLKESNFDQLYAYLKQHKVHANENKMTLEKFTLPTNNPLALVSNASVQQNPTQFTKNKATVTKRQKLWFKMFCGRCNANNCKENHSKKHLCERNVVAGIVGGYEQRVIINLDSDYFKDKMLLMQAQENGAVLDKNNYHGSWQISLQKDPIYDDAGPTYPRILRLRPVVHDSEDTREIAEITRKRMLSYRQPLVSDSGLFKTYDGEPFKAQDYVEKDHTKHTCIIRDINGADLLKGSPFQVKSWLWHRRLNHLNFGTINDLARKDLVRGLPRLKFERIIFAQPVNLEKARSTLSHKLTKSKNTNIEVLHTLHMDLCCPMRVQSIKEKYILDIVMTIQDSHGKVIEIKMKLQSLIHPTFLSKYSEDLGKFQAKADIGIFVGLIQRKFTSQSTIAAISIENGSLFEEESEFEKLKIYLITLVSIRSDWEDLPWLFRSVENLNTMAEQNIPAQAPARTDEQIVPRSQWLQIEKSNLLFDAQKIQKNQPSSDLSGHLANTNFFKLSSASAMFPSSLHSAVWNSMKHTPFDPDHPYELPPTDDKAQQESVPQEEGDDPDLELAKNDYIGTGKAIVTKEKVAHSLIDLSKKKRTTDQFILVRRDQAPHDSTTGPSSQPEDDTSEKVIHESSSTSDSERTKSETEAAAPKGQAGLDPEKAHEALAGPDPEPMPILRRPSRQLLHDPLPSRDFSSLNHSTYLFTTSTKPTRTLQQSPTSSPETLHSRALQLSVARLEQEIVLKKVKDSLKPQKDSMAVDMKKTMMMMNAPSSWFQTRVRQDEDKDYITAIEKKTTYQRIFRRLESFVRRRIKILTTGVEEFKKNCKDKGVKKESPPLTYAETGSIHMLPRITKMIADIEDRHHGPIDANAQPTIREKRRFFTSEDGNHFHKPTSKALGRITQDGDGDGISQFLRYQDCRCGIIEWQVTILPCPDWDGITLFLTRPLRDASFFLMILSRGVSLGVVVDVNSLFLGSVG
ncbi:retrovirus-related pol polyprotein from transposon TNT 1-94 [Tanacetum coccineum]